MKSTEPYSYSIVQKLEFTRFGGTEQEQQAANILQEEIKALGGSSRLMEFEIPAWEIQVCRITVTQPFTREVPCVAWGRSGQLPEGGAELALRFIELRSEAAFLGLEDLSGTAVLVNKLEPDLYRELVQRHAAAILIIAADKWYDEATDLPERSMRDHFQKIGRIPTYILHSRDAAALVLDGAQTLRLELRQEECTHISRNVIAEIPGTDPEWVVLTAHYDSIRAGTGSWDNASGCANLMEIYRHFLQNPPRRSMRFIWCGSEEQGLLGSKAYVRQYPEEVARIRFCFNFDMCGTVLGHNHLHITGSEELKTICRQICDEAGYCAQLDVGVHSSDSAPFCDQGIPAVGLSRYSSSAEVHTRNDLIAPISPAQLEKNAQFAIFFISRLVNAAVFPIRQEMPEEMKKELDKYFKRTQTPA